MVQAPTFWSFPCGGGATFSVAPRPAFRPAPPVRIRAARAARMRIEPSSTSPEMRLVYGQHGLDGAKWLIHLATDTLAESPGQGPSLQGLQGSAAAAQVPRHAPPPDRATGVDLGLLAGHSGWEAELQLRAVDQQRYAVRTRTPCHEWPRQQQRSPARRWSLLLRGARA